MKNSAQAAATWLVGRTVRLRPLETRDAREFGRFRLPHGQQTWAYVIQTTRGRDIGVLALLVEGPIAAVSVLGQSPSARAARYVTDALRVICAGAFRSMPLVRIEALVPASDAHTVRAHRHAGFTREGVIRQGLRNGRALCDAVLFSKLRDD